MKYVLEKILCMFFLYRFVLSDRMRNFRADRKGNQCGFFYEEGKGKGDDHSGFYR